MNRLLLAAIFLLLAVPVTPIQAASQSTEFTYQGKLSASGQPANGNFDMAFTLFDDATVGTQHGPLWLRSIL